MIESGSPVPSCTGRAERLFNEGHEAYMRTGPHYDFDHYRQLKVLEIKERLHQDFTAKLQLAKQKAQDHPVDEGCQEKIQEIKQDIIKNKEEES
uniref:Uncharacterized protein n=1 Tax=Oncorhynchus mykiss TaxID=8022 RepID=A0A8C7S6F6_ONCMY